MYIKIEWNYNCLLKSPENNNEKVDWIIPGLEKESKRDNYNKIKIISKENDDEIYENDKDKKWNNSVINEKIKKIINC